MGRSWGARWGYMPLPPGVDVLDLGRAPVPGRSVRQFLARTATLVIKPLWSSLGFGLMARAQMPLILDIDDPESALVTASIRTLLRSCFSLDGLTLPLMESLLGRADARTVASQVLQERYGGTLIPHARDEGSFTTRLLRDRRAARAALGLDPETPLIVWTGTPRSHKGLDVLLAAAPRLPSTVVLVGVSRRDTRRLDHAVRWKSANVQFVPPLPYAHVLQWITAADVVVVPQLDGPIGRAQAPAKLTDALGVGRAVVTSDLPPIREIISDAGILVPPGSPEALAQAVTQVLNDSTLREGLEASARRRFHEHLAASAVRPRLMRVLEELGA